MLSFRGCLWRFRQLVVDYFFDDLADCSKQTKTWGPVICSKSTLRPKDCSLQIGGPTSPNRDVFRAIILQQYGLSPTLALLLAPMQVLFDWERKMEDFPETRELFIGGAPSNQEVSI